jgi:hypothetical protein
MSWLTCKHVLFVWSNRTPSTQPGDSLAAMICGHEWLPIGLAISVSTLACFRTPMDEQQVGTMNTTRGTGGVGTTATSGGNTGTLRNTGQGGMTGTNAGTTGTTGGIPSYAGTTSSTGGTGGIAGAGGNRCTTDQNTCATDDDCTISDYRPPILSPADCYCFVCGFPVPKTIADDCQAAYVQFCGPGWNWQEDHNCPAPGCPAFQARCVAGLCESF